MDLHRIFLSEELYLFSISGFKEILLRFSEIKKKNITLNDDKVIDDFMDNYKWQEWINIYNNKYFY